MKLDQKNKEKAPDPTHIFKIDHISWSRSKSKVWPQRVAEKHRLQLLFETQHSREQEKDEERRRTSTGSPLGGGVRVRKLFSFFATSAG